MKVELKKELGSLFADVLELSQDDMPCHCDRQRREVMLASSKKDIDLKRDSILYWCECGQHGLTNSEDSNGDVPRPRIRASNGLALDYEGIVNTAEVSEASR